MYMNKKIEAGSMLLSTEGAAMKQYHVMRFRSQPLDYRNGNADWR